MAERIYDFGFYFFARVLEGRAQIHNNRSSYCRTFRTQLEKDRDRRKERKKTAVNSYILLAGRFLTRRDSFAKPGGLPTRDLKLNFITLKLRKMIRLGTGLQGELQPDTFSITLPARYNVFRFNVI